MIWIEKYEKFCSQLNTYFKRHMGLGMWIGHSALMMA
jgi:hypothetical protein